MKCSECQRRPEFICLCGYYLLCSDHLGFHMKLPGNHTPDQLSVSLSPFDYQAMKKEVIIRIKQIEKSKKKIQLQVKDLMMQLEISSKAAINELNNLNKSYYLFLDLESISNSLKATIDKVINTSLKVKDISINFNSNINDAFTKGLVSFVEKSPTKRLNKQKEEQKKKQDIEKGNDRKKMKTSPTQKGKKSDPPEKSIIQETKPDDISDKIESTVHEKFNIELESAMCDEREDSEINTKTLNSKESKDPEEEYRIKEIIKIKEIEKIEESSIFSYLSKRSSSKLLNEKKHLMDNLKIERYQKWFSNDGEYKCSVSEIKFSDDGLFSFICNKYTGK